MSTLRLTQLDFKVNRFAVEVVLEDDREPPRKGTAEFSFVLSAQDREDLRWYLEDYLQHFSDPAPKIATRIESRMAEIGAELFKGVFQTDLSTRELWNHLSWRLAETRVEIVTGIPDVTSLPWELLRDPVTNNSMALSTRAFVRSIQTGKPSNLRLQVGTGPIRILLVICRPGAPVDVPFRAVASRLVKALGETGRTTFQLDVLRPPTFDHLCRVLRSAKKDGTPYHIVHFDGHGIFANFYSNDSAAGRGYLAFENVGLRNNTQFINGTVVGKILAETGVSILVLNACRSAHVEPPQKPVPTPTTSLTGAESGHEVVSRRTRAFGSLAQEVVNSGVPGVVAMRYNVYVVTAAQFVADLYQALASGKMLGEAVTMGRKQLAAQPLRRIAFHPRPLQDWIVPIVYESSPVELFPVVTNKDDVGTDITTSAAAPANGSFADELRARPQAGFFGRDETLLAIDRALDTKNVVLLFSYAGSGKTSTAAEFARWYHATGGNVGPFLFTSFVHYKPLKDVLNETIGRIFHRELERVGINWFTLTDEQRREETLKLLADRSVLWVWDNVEPISGFPTRERSAWTDEQQKELAEFLRAASRTKAKFLLTSRRDEREWLGDLPARISIPPMPLQERMQMAEALAARQGRSSIDIENWLPLLRFTEGNPLTLLVLVDQALHFNLTTKTEFSQFVAKLRTGEARFEDASSEGRSKSLSASLSYGFENAFTDEERQKLALLYFFQGFLDVSALHLMVASDAEWRIPEIPCFTKDEAIELLNRAGRVGLLTARGFGFYSIHPALPWFFKELFEHYFGSHQERVARAFVETLWRAANQAAQDYRAGNRNMVAYLHFDQFNLLNALRLAQKYGWHNAMIGLLQGLYALYEHTGRRAEWASLLDEIKTEFVDPETDWPIPGRERGWFFINQRRVVLARQLHQFEESKRLQLIARDLAGRRAASALERQVENLGPEERDALQIYMILLNDSGELQVDLLDAECVTNFREALTLSQHLGDQYASAVAALNLGSAFLKIPELRDFKQAEEWFRTSLELRQPDDYRGRAQVFSLLGRTAYERYMHASREEKSDEQLPHLKTALGFYKSALKLTPRDDVDPLGLIHHQLGTIYYCLGQDDRSLFHFHKSIPYAEQQNDFRDAALATLFIGRILMEQNRLADAQSYAYAGLSRLEHYGGDHASADIKNAKRLIAEIEQRM